MVRPGERASCSRSTGGCSPTETARLLHISRATVHLWHRRYRAEGLAGLVDRPRSGRPTVLNRLTVERILLLMYRTRFLGHTFALRGMA